MGDEFGCVADRAGEAVGGGAVVAHGDWSVGVVPAPEEFAGAIEERLGGGGEVGAAFEVGVEFAVTLGGFCDDDAHGVMMREDCGYAATAAAASDFVRRFAGGWRPLG